jgi:hypothetical protein
MTQFTLLDMVGLIGVGLLLIAYGLTVGGKIDPLKPGALLLNWSALVIETAWSLIAIGGLVKWYLGRRA